MTLLFTLLVLFQLKHFIADYPLQTPYMLGKMKETDWQVPLLAHASVHAAFTFAIAIYFVDTSLALALAATDLVVHFLVDRLKASPKLGGRFKPTQSYFWWALGADQMAHHLTHYLIILIIITSL